MKDIYKKRIEYIKQFKYEKTNMGVGYKIKSYGHVKSLDLGCKASSANKGNPHIKTCLLKTFTRS